MPLPAEKTISIQQLAQAVQRRKWTGFIVFTLVFAAFVAAWLFLPREYGSEGRMVVRMGRSNLSMNASPDASSMVSIQDTRETEILAVMDLIKSQVVLGNVVDRIGPEKILENTIKLPLPSFSKTGEVQDEAATNYAALQLREKALKRLSGELVVASEKRSPNISIFCTGASPELAQEIVDEIMGVTQDLHVEVHSVKSSRSLFDRELAEKETDLKAAQENVASFATEHGFLSVDEARKTLNGVIDKLENDLVNTEVDLQQSLAMISELTHQESDVEIELNLPRTGMEKAATAGAQGKLYERIAEKARLMARYKQGHPKIDQINTEIERLRKDVSSLPEDRMEFAQVRNPVFEQLRVSLIKEKARAESLQGRLTQIKTALDEKTVRLAELNQLKTEAAFLDRQVLLAQSTFDDYAKKRNEARMVDQLDQEDISDVVIQQPATLMLKKVGPKGSVLVPAGVFFGVIFGLFAAIFADRKRLLYAASPEEIEESLEIPVLASIPRVPATTTR